MPPYSRRRAAGLLEGEKSEYVSFRAPPGLISPPKRKAGVTSMTELGPLALVPFSGRFARPSAKWLGATHRHPPGSPYVDNSAA